MGVWGHCSRKERALPAPKVGIDYSFFSVFTEPLAPWWSHYWHPLCIRENCPVLCHPLDRGFCLGKNCVLLISFNNSLVRRVFLHTWYIGTSGRGRHQTHSGEWGIPVLLTEIQSLYLQDLTEYWSHSTDPGKMWNWVSRNMCLCDNKMSLTSHWNYLLQTPLNSLCSSGSLWRPRHLSRNILQRRHGHAPSPPFQSPGRLGTNIPLR